MRLKKQIMALIMFVIMINMGIVVDAHGDGYKTIRVYGNVNIDGEGVEGAYITVEDTYSGDKDNTQTNGSGYFELYICTKNDRQIKVSVEFDDYYNDKSFIVEKYQSNYEINFEFESSPEVRTVKKFIGFIVGIDLYDSMIMIILFLLIILMLMKIHQEKKKIKD